MNTISLYGPDGPIDLSTMIFSGGEVQVRLNDLPPKERMLNVTIRAHLSKSDSIMELLMVTDALRRARPGVQIKLVAPYFPYARQDRVCAPGEALSLRVMADLINAQRYESVQIWDAHSDVAVALLDRAENVSSAILLREFISNDLLTLGEPPILVAPDAGALKKAGAAAKALNTHFIRADKSRDASTGAITGTVVYSEPVGNRDLLIVDDICDGGRTFVELAKHLRPLTTGRVMLYVTHGIFSYGIDVFDGTHSPLIDDVFVANPLIDIKRHSWTLSGRRLTRYHSQEPQ